MKRSLNRRELFDFLSNNRGYLKWGIERIKTKFASSEVTEEEVNEIRWRVKNNKGFEKSENPSFEDKEIENAFDSKLDSLGLSRDDVKTYKYWETHDGRPRFSIEPKSTYRSDFSSIEESLKDTLGDVEKPSITQPVAKGNSQCGVLGLHDAHIDKVVLASETGYDTDDTIEDNIESFKQQTLKLLKEASDKNFKKIYIPVGSDFWTVNDDRNTTKRGTSQRVTVPFQESFERGSKAIIECLTWAADHFPEVEVPVVYGNHDEDLDFFLGMLLEEAFSEVNHVNVNKDRTKRKYYKFGSNAFMFAHGYHCKTKSKMERLPLNFAEEATDIWSDTKGGIRKVFLGDIHNEEQHSFLRSKDSIGVNVQFMRSVSNSGKYEWDNGYTGVPKTAYLWQYNKEGNQENVRKNVWW